MQPTCALRTAAVLTLCAVALQLPAAAQVKPLYHGAAHLFTLPDATVVYPARAGTEGDGARLSAERRAAFLRSVHGMQAEVAADDAVSPEQLQGNLLLLGWDNRLLPTDEATRPIVEVDGGRTFLGDIRIGPHDDLIFGWGSPFNPRRFLVFWSRIDPELDRFLALPFVGSDWALYRDFLILGQGQFVAQDGWPPARNPFGERPPAPPQPLARGPGSAHYRLHHTSAVAGEAVARKILAAREAAWSRAVELLGAAPDPAAPIDLFVYRDPSEMRARSGVRDMPMYSLPSRRQMHTILELAVLDSPYEELHVLAADVLGPAWLSAMYEGLPASLVQGADLPLHAAALVDNHQLPSIADLLDEERLRTLVQAGIGRPAAGLLLRWLRSNTDADGFRRAYTLRSGGAAGLAAILGLEVAAMEEAFASWLGTLAAASHEDYRFNKMLTDARRQGAAGDREGELAALGKALELRPDDPETLYLIGLARLRGGEFSAAEASFKRLLAATSERTGTAPHVLGTYRLGQALVRLGRPDEALERFESLLLLPDLHESHRLAREAIEETRNRETED